MLDLLRIDSPYYEYELTHLTVLIFVGAKFSHTHIIFTLIPTSIWTSNSGRLKKHLESSSPLLYRSVDPSKQNNAEIKIK